MGHGARDGRSSPVGDLARWTGGSERGEVAATARPLAKSPAVLGWTSVPLPAPVASRLTPETVA